MSTIFLILHLAGAAVIAGLIIKTLVVLVQSRVSAYGGTAKAIALITAWQLITGSLLTIVKLQETSLLVFCARIGVYLAVVVAMEMLLLAKMRQAQLPFPKSFVNASVSAGLVAVVVTIVLISW